LTPDGQITDHRRRAAPVTSSCRNRKVYPGQVRDGAALAASTEPQRMRTNPTAIPPVRTFVSRITPSVTATRWVHVRDHRRADRADLPDEREEEQERKRGADMPSVSTAAITSPEGQAWGSWMSAAGA